MVLSDFYSAPFQPLPNQPPDEQISRVMTRGKISQNLPVDPAMPWQRQVCVNALFGRVVVYAMERGEGVQ